MSDDNRPAGAWLPQRAFALIGGLALLATGVASWVALLPTSRSLLFWLCWGTAAVGMAMLLSALLLKAGRVLSGLNVLAGNALVLVLLLGAGELLGRVTGFDFDALGSRGHADPRAEYPPCFREPEEPLGEVFFKRTGPAEWTGRPLSKILHLRSGTDVAYRDEPEFTLRYDQEGFRNPPDLKDWDVVVVGDSFTETGYLPVEQIFTSVAAVESGRKIKNLGICNTGPFTHLEYLKRFGAGPGCKIAVLAFYEGNDISDAQQEADDLQHYRATGIRPFRALGAQTSFLKAVYQRVKPLAPFSQAQSYRNATFIAAGQHIPITLQPSLLPPDPQTMPPEQKQLVAQFLDAWLAEVAKLGMQPWLLYLPINNRTYHGLWQGNDNLPRKVADWKPGELPVMMRNLCAERKIRFVDTCPALRAAAERGVLVYNPIFDTHLNREGSRLVGEVLAKALKEADPLP